MENTSEYKTGNSSSPELVKLISLTWDDIRNPLLWIDYLLPCFLNGVLTVTALKDPLKCFRSCSSYLVFNIGLLGFLPFLILILHILALSYSCDLHLALYASVFGFYNTLCAVFLLAVDCYILACKPLLYSMIVTKRRVVYCVIFSWNLSATLATSAFLLTYNVTDIVLAAKIFVFTLFPIVFLLLIVIMILNIKTRKTVAQCFINIQRLCPLSRQNGNTLKKITYRAVKERLKNERRFSKVVLLLHFNSVFFILPQVLLIGTNAVNIWCEFCINETYNQNLKLFHAFIFPLFYTTMPVIHIAFIPKYRSSCRNLFVNVTGKRKLKSQVREKAESNVRTQKTNN